jgi:phage terminase large subunit
VLHSPIKYKPFDDLLRARECASDTKYWNALRTVHTVIFTGGRDSGKSHSVSRGLCDAAANYNHRILYTRYTLTSAQDSIIPDFQEKIAMLNYEPYFHVTKDRILGKHNRSKIVFKGIKTSSGIQTANLKSLKDFSMFVVEEAEEFPSYEQWDKIQLSIRATDVQAMNVLILNPATKKHWIYKEFFQKNGVKAGFNGIRNNIMFIHTTYLDLGKKFIAPKNWAKYESARVIYEKIEALTPDQRKEESKDDIRTWKYYKFTVLGGWKDSEEGLVYPDYELFKDFPTDYKWRIYGLDFGFSKKGDQLAFVECVLAGKNDLYIKQHIYKTGLLNRDSIPMIKAIVHDLSKTYIVADCSDPKEIAEFRAEGITLIPCDKTYGGNGMSKMRGINKMKNFNIHIHEDSADLIDEIDHYHFVEITNARGETITHVVDKDDHLLDASMYASTRY